MSLSVSHNLKKLTNEPQKIQNLAKNQKFCQNHQKSTNIGFCDNSFNKSLVLILKYTVCKCYDGVRLLLRKWDNFEFEKKKGNEAAKKKKWTILKKSDRNNNKKKLNNLTKFVRLFSLKHHPWKLLSYGLSKEPR